LVLGPWSSANERDAFANDQRQTTKDESPFACIQAYNAGIKTFMPSAPDDLTSLKDDMIAFIEGHGMRRFPGLVDYEQVQSVTWKSEDNPDSWKDFVELAKASGAPFLTMDSWRLEREELDAMIERLSTAAFSSDEDVEDARWLRTYIGKTGFVQLGFSQQGVMMVYEASTLWYDRYQNILEMADDFAGFPIDETDSDDEP
jgi:hypothetical protein